MYFGQPGLFLTAFRDKHTKNNHRIIYAGLRDKHPYEYGPVFFILQGDHCMKDGIENNTITVGPFDNSKLVGDVFMTHQGRQATLQHQSRMVLMVE